MDATSGREAALTTHGRGRRRALGCALTAAIAIGLMAAMSAPAGAATCAGAGAVQSRSYSITHLMSMPQNVNDFTGQVQQGDIIFASFTTDCPTNVRVTLLSYYAPGPTFNANTAGRQTVASSSSGLFSAGTHSNALQITVPECYFQADFVQGDILQPLGHGPGGQGFYSEQGRLVDAANGGTNACPQDRLLP